MHIADGLLSPEVCIATGMLSAGAVAFSLHQLNSTLSVRTVPLTGMMAALLFAGQMVNFPLIGAPVSGHLLGGVLAAVIVGPWAGCVAVSLVLMVQMALFADGGWLSYGANVLNMGVAGSLGGYGVYAALRSRLTGTRGVVIGAVLASWVSVLAASSLFCLEFLLSHPHADFDFQRIFVLMTTIHSFVGVGEALICGWVVSAIAVARPDLIYSPGAGRGRLAAVGRFVWAGSMAALVVAAFLSPFASDASDGLEAVVEQTQIGSLVIESRPLLLAGYDLLPHSGTVSQFWQRLSVSLAGLLGTGVVLAIAWLLGRAVRRRVPAVEGRYGD